MGPRHSQTGLFSSSVASLIAISYPTLRQDSNATTESLLSQISQQLANANSNGSFPISSPSTQRPFSPPALAVFVNAVWFLSLVLSLSCALMATLLHQWARRYLQIIQRNHAPHVRAHIREYFSLGAHKFGIDGLAELLPSILLLSVLLFFTGLVAFAFQANDNVAYITLACVVSFLLAYIYFTLKPLISPDCPYYTPLTSIISFSTQRIALSFSLRIYRSAEYLHDHFGKLVSADSVKRCRGMYERRAKAWSEDVISRLSNLATQSSKFSMDIYKTALTWTLDQLDQDLELEKFVAGIPGLYESEIFSKVGADSDDNGRDDIQRTLDNIRPVLADLPRPRGFDAPLPWSIIRLARRSITSDLSKPIQQKRTQACLRALYFIPGAIRDVLAVYAAKKYHCPKILPLLNSPESLEVIDELRKKSNDSNDDVALSVRCAAAVVAAFIITPPSISLDSYSVTDGLKWGEGPGRQFLEARLRDDPDASPDTTLDAAPDITLDAAPDVTPDAAPDAAPPFDLNSDTARLQNITRFLTDIKYTLQDMNQQPWQPDSAESILRQELFKKRHTREYVDGKGMFDQPGNRTSLAFVPAAQQDLITLTLEILARDPVANAETPQREAFRDVRTWLEQEQETTLQVQPEKQGHDTVEVQPHLPFQLEAGKAKNSFEMVKLALGRVFEALPDTTPVAVHTSPP